ncbi:hypothetical protein TNCV_604431 [Trichonephila clavipes]|nr:hypothetical protein TNCV_604431 [Trichonephila clavipes]
MLLIYDQFLTSLKTRWPQLPSGHGHGLVAGFVKFQTRVLMPLRTRRVEGLMYVKSVEAQRAHIGLVCKDECEVPVTVAELVTSHHASLSAHPGALNYGLGLCTLLVGVLTTAHGD